MNFSNLGEVVPTKIDIKLKGGAKKTHVLIQGVYFLQSNHVNGKRYWLQSEGLHALWYVKGNWMIGNKAKLGKNFGRMHTKDSVGPLDASSWSYHNGVKWIETNDLIILTGS